MERIANNVESTKSMKIRDTLTQFITLGSFSFSFSSLFKKIDFSPFFYWFVYFCFTGMIASTVLIIWKVLMCLTGSESPVVVVLSGSMEPGFKRVKNPMFCFCSFFGLDMNMNVDKMWFLWCCLDLQQGDILFLHMSKAPVRIGEIVVYNVEVCSFYL